LVIYESMLASLFTRRASELVHVGLVGTERSNDNNVARCSLLLGRGEERTVGPLGRGRAGNVPSVLML
jgi:hypothetical protein